MDIDLMGRTDNSLEHIRFVVEEICGLAVEQDGVECRLACLSVRTNCYFSGALNDAGKGDRLKELHEHRALIRPEVSTCVDHMNKWNIPLCRVHHERKRTWRPDGPKETHLRTL
jgi:hypothetical protein